MNLWTQCKGKNRNFWFGIPVALVLTACTTVGPDFTPLEPETGDDWSLPLGPDIRTVEQVPLQWWEIFNDSVLNGLVDEARAQNPGLETTALRVLESRARLGIAAGLRFPQAQFVSGDATYVSPSESDILELLDIDDFWRYSLGATVTWEADFWGRYRRGIEAADAALRASEAAYDQAMVLLTAQTVSAYVIVRETEEQLRISRDNATLQQRSYDLTQVLYRNGDASELDVQQALTLLLSTEATIPALEASLQQARNALSGVLGRGPGYVDGTLGEGRGIPAVPADIVVGLPADMLRRRPDVLEAEMLAMAQSAVVGVTTADLYPSFRLAGTLTTAAGGPGGSSASDLFSSGSFAGTLGGGFVWPFLNYDRIRNNIRIEDAKLQQALLNYQVTVLRALRESENAIAGFVGAREQDRILARAVAAAERSNDLSLLRFREGFSDYQRVLDSQQRLFNQQQRYTANRAAIARNAVEVFKALGGGWETRSGMPRLTAATIDMMRNRTDWGGLLDTYPE